MRYWFGLGFLLLAGPGVVCAEGAIGAAGGGAELPGGAVGM